MGRRRGERSWRSVKRDGLRDKVFRSRGASLSFISLHRRKGSYLELHKGQSLEWTLSPLSLIFILNLY